MSYSNRKMGLNLLNPCYTKILLTALLLFTGISGYAQENYRLPLNKPEKYTNRALGAEKTEDTKFTLPRRLIQGMYTHYNYYYNAQNKITAIVDKAKANHQDDYTQLLSFYNYNLNSTAGDSLELDSVIYKATAGIVLHDLRNSYIDNLYLLIGQAYFYWQKFDSAYRIFQFVNYQFFPKGKNDFNKVVASGNRAAGGNLEIGTLEKKGVVQKAFSQPPSRNDALLWIAKTYVEDSLFAEANSLMLLLRNDPYFPKRLHPALNEVAAYVFYRQQQWDSCAFYLEKALPNAPSQHELSRWEYLLAQLHTMLKQPDLASRYYNKAKIHTTDPVMYIYARLNEAQLTSGSGTDALRTTLNDIVQLSRKERFDGYEDILYAAAANSAIKLGDSTLAKTLLQKSIRNNSAHPSLKNKTLLLLADISYAQRDYMIAANCYDSLDLKDPLLEPQRELLDFRKKWMQELVKNIRIVAKEDSLQAVSKLPENELENYLKTLSKKLRKERGIKEEASAGTEMMTEKKTEALFNNDGKQGEWYFSNASAKAKGFSQFKAKWGNRPNIDQWRRMEAVEMAMGAKTNIPSAEKRDDAAAEEEEDGEDISVEGLRKQLIFSEEAQEASDEKIITALLNQGMIYKEKLDDYLNAAAAYEALYKRFPQRKPEELLLYELYDTHNKIGQIPKSQQYLQQLEANYGDGDYLKKMRSAKSGDKKQKDTATLVYEKIYERFLEGAFERALKEKQSADTIYGKTYWTPQLLYIEAVYHISRRSDSAAITALSHIVQEFAQNPMAEKANIMMDVLSRRNEIEAYLSATEITRTEEDYIPVTDEPTRKKKAAEAVLEKPEAPKPKSVNLPTEAAAVNVPPNETKPVIQQVDSIVKKQDNVVIEKPSYDGYLFDPAQPHLVVMLLDNVDPIYVSESRGALIRYLRTAHSQLTLEANTHRMNERYSWIEIGTFANLEEAMRLMEPTRQQAGSRIVPWLANNKYRFLVISAQNLATLKAKKDPETYLQFLQQQIPGKF